MIDAKRINVGDDVSIRISEDASLSLFGKVLYIPQDTGDCWIVEDLTGTIFYVHRFLVIRKAS